MEQRISFITLGVDDLAAMKKFYIEKFGWEPMSDGDNNIVFFQMNGFILSLYPADALAEDARIKNNGKGFKRVTLGICMPSEKKVNDLFEKLHKNGVKVVKEPQKVFWGGYSGYVEDPENNLWEIAYNPFLKMDKNKNVVGHA